jgi:YidC/Oxa1 family membrane protein insertase
MQRQFLLAIALSFLVIYGWNAMFPPPKPQPPKPVTSPQTVTSAPSGTAAPPAQAPPTPEQTVQPELAKPLVAAAAAQEIVVDSPAVRAVFNTRGGTLTSWRLKNYRDGTGAPLELVPENVAGAVKPFTLEVEDAATTAKLRDALFKPDHDAIAIGSAPVSLTFAYQGADGLTARKVFAFNPAQPYVIGFTAEATQNGNALNPAVQWGPALGTGIVTGGMTYAPPSQPIFYRDGSVTRVAIGKIESHRQEGGTFGFAGVDDHYFLAAIVSPPQPLQVRYDPMVIPAAGQSQPLQFISWTVKGASPLKDAEFFFGPKDLDLLQGVKTDLVRAIHFGIFDWLVVPLLRALKWVNGYIGNYGWSIIALTVLINLAMFPLRHKSVVSMRKMQEIQPQMKAIQERYAKLKMTDPARQKMNEEVMALYKQHGTNPAAGCVPMLLTLPVLIAFYSMLSVAIELRGAPFIGWIRDLSSYDPLYITPVLMGLTQFVQTRMQPVSADPMQQKMMMFMPLMFAGMLLWAPSGLVLYWTVSNIWTIGQQVITNKIIGPGPQHTVRPPAERQLKAAGAGKSPQAAKERK